MEMVVEIANIQAIVKVYSKKCRILSELPWVAFLSRYSAGEIPGWSSLCCKRQVSDSNLGHSIYRCFSSSCNWTYWRTSDYSSWQQLRRTIFSYLLGFTSTWQINRCMFSFTCSLNSITSKATYSHIFHECPKVQAEDQQLKQNISLLLGCSPELLPWWFTGHGSFNTTCPVELTLINSDKTLRAMSLTPKHLSTFLEIINHSPALPEIEALIQTSTMRRWCNPHPTNIP